MNLTKMYLIVILGLSFLLCMVFAAEYSQKKSLTFGEVVDNLDLAKKTSMYVKEYWLRVKGEKVNWSGEVVNVKGGRNKVEVYVANKDRRTYKGYNIILIGYDKETASKFEIGQKISFSGYLHNYKTRKGNPVVISLNEADFKQVD
jgi:hypothetical protein